MKTNQSMSFLNLKVGINMDVKEEFKGSSQWGRERGGLFPPGTSLKISGDVLVIATGAVLLASDEQKPRMSLNIH